MQASSATKDSKQPDSSGLNWRQRKKANMRRKQLVDGYVAALGGSARVTPIQMQDIERAVDLDLLARKARADLSAGGRTSIHAVVKLENVANRAVLRLNLPAPGSSAEPVQTLADYLASKRAAVDAGAED